MKDILVLTLLIVGTLLMLIASIGIVRMPDLYTRMSTTSKAATLGAGLTLVAVATYFAQTGIWTRALAAILFLLLTIPVASHAIGRAAYLVGVPLWNRTQFDDLRGHYDARTHDLESSDDAEADR